MGTRLVDSVGRKKKRLGDILMSAGVLTEDQLMEGLSEQKVRGTKLGQTLVELGILTEDEIAQALSRQLGMSIVKLGDQRIPDEVLHIVSSDVLKKYNLIPYEFDEFNMNILKVAMADPLDLVALDDLQFMTPYQIEPVVCTPTEVSKALDRYFGNAEAMKVAEQFSRERAEKEVAKKEESNDEIDNSPIVQLVNKIMEQAVRQRSSDIHIEPLETSVRVRYRIDGVLKAVMSYGTDILNALVARVKIIGGMDIAEKRKPQDGRITTFVDRQEYDVRVSILPTVYGEKIVMRMTSKTNLTREKKQLGFSDSEMAKFDDILRNPHGIILVTGPTGSGKSTTLYTALSELNTEGVNIITVEDPVEANIDGINQVQVNNKAEMTFAAALRSILRQDPDIIMIGEIRDGETANIAVQASITGHLVVSTLHTNSAASTITRLEDMGIEPYLIADSTVGVIAQRLVRRVCQKCRKERFIEPHEMALMQTNDPNTIVYDAVGCEACDETGYRGRIGVYEIMPLTQRIKEIISKGGNAEAIKNVALEEGMQTLEMSTRRLVYEGVTSFSELLKISYESH